MKTKLELAVAAPCPHCGAQMGGDADYMTHPTNGCFLSGWEFDHPDLAKWNRRAAIQSQPDAPVGVDTQRLDFIESGTVDLRCHDAPTPGGDDADVFWTVVEHHMAKPHEREIGWGNNAREAIDAAIKAQGSDAA